MQASSTPVDVMNLMNDMMSKIKQETILHQFAVYRVCPSQEQSNSNAYPPETFFLTIPIPG